MPGTSGLTSVSGLLSLLDEESDEIREHSLRQLNENVNEFWPEIADSVDKIEILFENESFKGRELAALVASKVYYHLEQYSESMNFALGAGKLFDVSQSSEYVDTLVAKCIDEYIRVRTAQAEARQPSDAPSVDPRLEAVVLGMFDRCFHDRRFKQALGIAIETRRLDKIEQAISGSNDVPGMLAYAQKLCTDIIINRDFRQTVLRLLVKLYQTLKVPDYIRVSECLIFLDDSKAVADILTTLLQSGKDDDTLVAYQIAFDLVNNGTQQFLSNVLAVLPKGSGSTSENNDQMPPLESMDVDKSAATPAAPAQSTESDRFGKLRSIISGETTISKNLDFLFRNNNTDLLILKNIKTAVESRSSVLHSATIFANALMHAGTTSDQFLRDNLEWLSRATNWAKFAAIAGLGVIHRGHLKEGLSLLSPYLPQSNVSGSAYSEGGSLYALGMIHANHGANIISYITKALQNASGNEIVQHGACLGLGVAAMATDNQEVYEALSKILFMDSAVAGEAAGLAMGLVAMGTASERAIEEMLTYAHETQHEKIIRGLAIGMAIVMYGREEQADTLIEQLISDKDPILRYGGMYTVGLAYSGTANNAAIKRLLHVAVSDVSDDVRRAAVTCLGFLLFRQPEQCPRVVSLLAESYNPHVRYGACLALGISCAGTSLKEAIDILEPLTSDAVDFVRQGALIGLSMILMQATKAQEPKVEAIRKIFEDKINDKHEDIMCKFGAILGTGIIDAGGRNVTIALHSRSGHKNMTAIVGLAVFTQFWYWYPLVYFVNLAFTPTAIIGLNKDLQMPVFSFKSNARPSLFAYPPKVQPPTTVAPTKVKTAVLSIASRNKNKSDKKKDDKMEVDTKPEEKKEEKPAEETPKVEEKKPEPEPEFETKTNPARVTATQIKHLTFGSDDRYKPVKEGDVFGIVMLRDTKPGEPEQLVAAASTSGGAKDDEPEPEAPEPFEFDPDKN
eukprot:TRINITY_DN2003_c0_g1_i1.p1 TRINITY_DN2003_c0_g1~~TRINITY_DN2003_c0_g1_i1.p1  ORF type:complete len:963 (-),score=285.53 TRINITY_DN2003_c0_g1_i1:59-2947(-)